MYWPLPCCITVLYVVDTYNKKNSIRFSVAIKNRTKVFFSSSFFLLSFFFSASTFFFPSEGQLFLGHCICAARRKSN